MNTRGILRLWLAGLIWTIVIAAPAYAGGSADSKVGVERFGEAVIRSFALKVNDQLDRHHINVAIVARAGRSRSELPRGISYTHVAFIVFEPVQGKDGGTFYTYTVYNLYQDGNGREDHSYLKQDLTYDFVAGIREPDIAICVPVEELQRRILATIRSPAYRGLYNPAYNLLTNPWVDLYDNCVSHTLKICMAAIYQTDDRDRIYENMRRYFKPTPVHLGLLQSIGASFIKAVRNDDMDPAGFQTASYDSLAAFLDSNHLMKEAFTVSVN